jgi:hypothetical protein
MGYSSAAELSSEASQASYRLSHCPRAVRVVILDMALIDREPQGCA